MLAEKPDTELVVAQVEDVSPMRLLQLAVRQGAPIDTIERLAKLQREVMDYAAQQEFADAMNLAQAEIPRVAPDLMNEETKTKYPSYAALDRVLRPIYTSHGFSISYNTGNSALPEHISVFAIVRHRSGYRENYQIDIPTDGKGPKGGAMMTKTHATVAGSSYGMRCLLKLIFNVAVGEEDKDGNPVGPGLKNDAIAEHIERIKNCGSLVDLQRVFNEAWKVANADNDKNAIGLFIRSRDERKKQLGPVVGKIPDTITIERLEWLREAKDMEELRRLYGSALDLAKQEKDQLFADELTKAANKRAEVLRANV